MTDNEQLKSLTGKKTDDDDDKYKDKMNLIKPERCCNRQTLFITITSSLFMIVIISLSIAIIICAYYGFALDNQKSIWGFTLCTIFLFITIIANVLFVSSIKCGVVLFKKPIRNISDGSLLLSATVVIIFLCCIITASYFSICTRISCEPFNMVKDVIKKNATLS